MQWKNTFYFIALLLNVAPAEQEKSNENDKDVSQLQTATFILHEHMKKVYVHADDDFKKQITTRQEQIRNHSTQIWQNQSALGLATTELAARVSWMRKENQENSAKLLMLSEQFPELIQNLASVLKAEIRKNVNNALEPMKESLSANSVEFDENLNFVSYGVSLPSDCEEALRHSQREEGVFVLKSNEASLRMFGAYCKRYEGKVWTVIQRRQDGSVNFYRNWQDYKNGFGHLDGEYWLGLDRIHALTATGKHELWVKLMTTEDKIFTARYAEFSVANEREGYQLKIGGFVGSLLDDELRVSNGMKFSTLDTDNDLNRYENCAGAQKSAWWYRECGFTTLNGQYGMSSAWFMKGIWWFQRVQFVSLKYVHLAIHAV